MARSRNLSVAVIIAIALGATVAAKTKFSSVMQSPEAAKVSFSGKKIAALVIDKDDSLRVSGEESLVNELNARGMRGVASYRIMPKEELRNTDNARGWYEKSDVQGVVALKVVSNDRYKTITPSTWTTAYYQDYWGYYGQSWGAVFTPGSERIDHFVSIETLIYSLPDGHLLWAGVSLTENVKTSAQVIAEVAKEAVKEMNKQGLARHLK
jgi:hypothetical protein